MATVGIARKISLFLLVAIQPVSIAVGVLSGGRIPGGHNKKLMKGENPWITT